MLKYLEDIHSETSNTIAAQNHYLFLTDPESFKKIKDVAYQPIFALEMYRDAVKAGYQPLIDAAKIALEGSIEDVKLSLSK
jgi:hypothetical protein